jgi:trk system potassium uptake protein
MLLRKIEPTDQIVLSFILVILAGTLLLHLPASSGSDRKVHLRACLFTATSAVCVTGLTVKDTGTDFSLLGQVFITILIQVGGLGILTFSNWLVISLKQRRSDLGTRMLLSESHGSLPYVEPVRLLKHIILYTFLCEGVGTLLLFIRFVQDFPAPQAFWQALFHSVAAFCNAGFSLFRDNLIGYQGDVIVNLTIVGLIILGGLGFVVFSDITHFISGPSRESRRKHLSFHTRVVLWTTGILVIAFTLVFLVLEWGNTMKDFPVKDRLLASLFLSVTPRTAGFNTVDTGQLSNTTLILEIFLMGVGASPGSTGGGIKTTTFAVLVALIWSRSKGRQRVELMGRSIPLSVISKSIAVGAAYALVTIMATMIMEFVETSTLPSAYSHEARGLFLNHLFEVVSALGTVGLSTGITPKLTGTSQILLVFVMLIGRLGPLLLAESLVGAKKPSRYSLPEDYVMVG